MFYGWGRTSRDWTMPDGRVLVCSYSYISLMFIFKLVWKRRWALVGRDRAMDQETNRGELARIYGDGNVPDIGIFERFGMFIFGGLIVAAAGVVSLSSALGFGSDETEAGGPVAEVIASGGLSDAIDDDAVGGEDQADGEDPDGGVTPTSAADEAASPGDDEDAAAGESMDEDAAEDGDAGASPDPDGTESGASAGGAGYEEAWDIVSIGQTDLASTNVDRPFQGWSQVVVHGAYTAESIDGDSPGDGEKLVVVEYQLLGIEKTANIVKGAFRLIGDGQQFSLVGPTTYNTISGGEVVNSYMYFFVPEEVTDFQLEIGVLDAAADGYQASFAFELEPAEAPAEAERYSGPDVAGTVNLASPETLMTGTPQNLNPNFNSLDIEVLGATMTGKVGPDGARPGFKFVVIDVELTSTGQYGLWQTSAHRVVAEGELYGTGQYINESLATGETARTSLVFEVPLSTDSVLFESGVPDGFETGDRAVYEITFE